MELESVKLIATAIVVGLGTLGPGIAIGLIGGKSVEAISRNKEAQANIFPAMILCIAFAEAIAIYALVIGLILKYT